MENGLSMVMLKCRTRKFFWNTTDAIGTIAQNVTEVIIHLLEMITIESKDNIILKS